MNYGPIGLRTSRLLSILRGVQIRGSSLICINFAVLRNRYGHPHEEVIERLTEIGAAIYQTAEIGQITITFEKNKKLESLSSANTL